jgi:uncharacterized protein YcbK (DUF882 family)
MKVLIDDVPYGPIGAEQPPADTLPDGYLSPHFREEEFCCNHCNSMEGHEIPEMLLSILEDCRRYFGSVPTTINSGYRCKTHNDNVGSNDASQHRLATAADIVLKGVSPSLVHSYLLDMYPSDYGIGRYDSFTHIDVRPTKARW